MRPQAGRAAVGGLSRSREVDDRRRRFRAAPARTWGRLRFALSCVRSCSPPTSVSSRLARHCSNWRRATRTRSCRSTRMPYRRSPRAWAIISAVILHVEIDETGDGDDVRSGRRTRRISSASSSSRFGLPVLPRIRIGERAQPGPHHFGSSALIAGSNSSSAAPPPTCAQSAPRISQRRSCRAYPRSIGCGRHFSSFTMLGQQTVHKDSQAWKIAISMKYNSILSQDSCAISRIFPSASPTSTRMSPSDLTPC